MRSGFLHVTTKIDGCDLWLLQFVYKHSTRPITASRGMLPTNESAWQHHALWHSHLLSVRISAVATLVAWEVSFPEQWDQDRNRLLHSKYYFLPHQLQDRSGVVCIYMCVCVTQWLPAPKLPPRLPTLMRCHPEPQAQSVFVCAG